MAASLPLRPNAARRPDLPGAATVIVTDGWQQAGDFIPVRFYADVSSIADIARSSTLTRVVDAVHSLDVPIGQARLPPYRRWCRTRSCRATWCGCWVMGDRYWVLGVWGCSVVRLIP
jgi:hypothetical protein